LADALGHLECRATQVIEAGDHTIFIGQVEAAHAREGEPLLYFRGAYRRVGN
jgi:flavin reductase (DIM6/NTAB) family NADH-FMN oxidoreductase RutF